jgi:uncharacterized protein (TIGR02246 family)
MLKRLASFRLKGLSAQLLLAVIGAVIGSVATLVFGNIFPTPAPDAKDKQQIEQLIAGEAKLAVAHDLEEYRQLFAPDAWVVEVSEERIWSGQDAIVERLRPLHFRSVVHTPKEVFVTEDGSLAFAETTTIFDQEEPEKIKAPGREYWQFRKDDRTWKILSFQYALR